MPPLAKGNRTYRRGPERARDVFPNRRIKTMGLFTRDIKTMNDLFVHQFRTSITPRNNS